MAAADRIGLRHLRDPEVGDHRPSRRFFEQDVVGFHVAVHHPLRVSVAEGPGHLAEDARRLVGTERPRLADPLTQGAPRDIPHHEVDESLALGDRVDRDHMWMRKARRRLRFTEETLPEGGLGGEDRREELEGDVAVERHVARQVDHAHPAAAQFPFEGVVPGEDPLEFEEELVRSLRHGPPTGLRCTRLHQTQGNPR